MPGDYSRDTFDSRKHYLGVLEQQGRVRTDAEANEGLAIHLHRTETETRDVIGACGVPKKNLGFGLTPAPDGTDLIISAGRIYVEGRLCETESEAASATFERAATDRAIVPSLYADGRAWKAGDWASLQSGNQTSVARVTTIATATRTLTFAGVAAGFPTGAITLRRLTSYLTQVHYPSPQFSSAGPSSPPSSPPTSPPSSPPVGVSLNLPAGNYLAYLEVWEREVTALEDPRIREVALGGPDTTTRLQNLWRVLLFPLPESSPSAQPDCTNAFPEWQELIAPTTGRLNARTVTPSPPDNPCELPPGSGYRRLENQLYRVEVHQGGSRANATFKWSRDNGTVVSSIESISGTRVVVSDTGKDRFLSFAEAQWVEVYSDESDLTGNPHALVEIVSVDPDTREIVVTTSLASLEGRSGLKLRRWDQRGASAGSNGVSMPAGWVAIEDGIQVQFGAGTYRAGDYWLIPARTSLGEIEWPPFEVPNESPIAQLPHGVRRRYCKLAIIQAQGGQLVVEDCRKQFPSLSDICAEDVCFDNSHCDFAGAETVQDALDRLCEARDLRFHNKHLHGKGVVCGLQVRCGPNDGRPRRNITIRPGYAIDCEGRDLVLERTQQLDVLSLVDVLPSSPPTSPPGSPPGSADREYRLRIDLGPGNQPIFSMERAQPVPNPFAEALKGTLIRDFLDRCFEPVAAALREATDGGNGGPIVGIGQQRLSAVTSATAPILSGNTSAQPFISRNEHQTLQDLYDRLRRILRSSAYCALLDNLRPMPNYPFGPLGVDVVFGSGFQTTVAIATDGNRAYTFGTNNMVLVADLQRNEVIAEEAFPGDENLRVRAVAPSTDGRRIYAVAEIGANDSSFAVADVVASGLKWRSPTVLCGVRISAIAVGSKPERVYATGIGKGLYEINPDNPDAKPQPKHAFKASGDIALFPEANLLYATAASGDDPSQYDHIVRINLTATGDVKPQVFPLKRGEISFKGTDGLALAVQNRGAARLMVAVESANNADKQVMVFDALASEPSRAESSMVPLGSNEPVTLAYNRIAGVALAAFENTHRIGFFDPAAARPVEAHYPVGVSPRAVLSDSSGQNVYVMNTGSNTMMRIPADQLRPAATPDSQQLAEYRARVVEALADLFAALVQHVKDCFCDLLLKNCPECEDPDRLYLATVHVRGGEVVQVCNLEGRKHVHSFPKFFYWLSLAPVLPLLGVLFEKLCCVILPEIAGRYQAPRPAGGVPGVGSNVLAADLIRAVSSVNRTSFSALTNRASSTVRLGGSVLQDLIKQPAKTRRLSRAVLAQSDLAGLQVDAAREKLAQFGVQEVVVEAYDADRGVGNLIRVASLPNRLRSSDRVTLVTHEGIVRFARVSPRQVAGDDSGKSKALEQEVARLHAELQDSRKKFEEDLDARDRRITVLEDKIKIADESSKAIKQIRSEIEKLTPRKRKPGG